MSDNSTRHYALIFIAALLAFAFQFAFPGYYHKIIEDGGMLPKFACQFAESYRQGILYPRWMAEDFYGYGSPAFLFYPPLLYMLSSLPTLASFSLPLTASMLYFASMLMGGVFLYLLVEKNWGKRAAIIAAMCYILLPTRMFDMYYINTPAGRFAQGFMPAALYFAQVYAEAPSGRKGFAGFAFSYAGLVLSHIALAYIFTPFLAVFSIWGTAGKASARKIARLAAMIPVGLCLSAFYFLPVLFERRYVQMDNLLVRFPYWQNYVFNVLNGQAAAEKGPIADILVKSISAEMLVLMGIIVLITRKKSFEPDSLAKLFAVFLLVCLFMMSSLSGFIWRYAPGLSTVQFAYRFDTVYLILFAAMAGVSGSALLSKRDKGKTYYFLFSALAGSILFFSVMLVVYSRPLPADYALSFSRLPYIQQEYLPRSVDVGFVEGLSDGGPELSSMSEFSYTVVKLGYTDRKFALESPAGARLRVRTFYFPGWRAWVDGEETAIGVEDGSGAMLIDVPPGKHEVELRFTDTLPRTAGKIVSVVTMLMLVFPYGLIRRRLNKD